MQSKAVQPIRLNGLALLMRFPHKQLLFLRQRLRARGQRPQARRHPLETFRAVPLLPGFHAAQYYSTPFFKIRLAYSAFSPVETTAYALPAAS